MGGQRLEISMGVRFNLDVAPKVPAQRSNGRFTAWRIVGRMALALAAVTGCAPHASHPALVRVPVVAAPAVKGDIGAYLTGLGSITPLYSVTVRTRVD